MSRCGCGANINSYASRRCHACLSGKGRKPGTYTHAEARQLAEASSPLMVRVVDQLIGEALQAQGEHLDTLRKMREMQLEILKSLERK